MPLALFPTDCRALIVEPEPVQAMALDLLLEEFGCHCVVPIVSPREIERCLRRSQPSFALVDVSLDKELLPVAECLASKEVPFAVLTFGAPSEPFDRSGWSAPRLTGQGTGWVRHNGRGTLVGRASAIRSAGGWCCSPRSKWGRA